MNKNDKAVLQQLEGLLATVQVTANQLSEQARLDLENVLQERGASLENIETLEDGVSSFLLDHEGE